MDQKISIWDVAGLGVRVGNANEADGRVARGRGAAEKEDDAVEDAGEEGDGGGEELISEGGGEEGGGGRAKDGEQHCSI